MHRLNRAALAAIFSLLAGAANAEPVTYTIVSKLSRVNFNFEHQGFIPVSGSLKIAPGSFTFDNQDWNKSSVAVTLPVKMLDMGDGLWNRQIRGDEEWKKLFSSNAISFRSTKLVRKDPTHGVLYGDLTLAGVTQPVKLDMRVNKIGRNEVSEKSSIGITATTVIKRSKFGLDAYMDLVGDDMAVQIQLEAAVGADTDAQQEAMLNEQGVAPGSMN